MVATCSQPGLALFLSSVSTLLLEEHLGLHGLVVPFSYASASMMTCVVLFYRRLFLGAVADLESPPLVLGVLGVPSTLLWAKTQILVGLQYQHWAASLSTGRGYLSF